MRGGHVQLIVLLLAGALLGCGKDETAAEEAIVGAGEEEGASTYTYQVLLSSVVTDTLRGKASFGQMRDPQTGENLFVIRLASSYDFVGGFLIARRNPDLPAPGNFGIASAADSLAPPESDFVVLYREGMLRDMRSLEGTLILTTVTDTLIAGRFNAVLSGYYMDADRRLSDARLQASGRFRAQSGVTGYFMGL